jgi:hypothetical protein
MPHGLLPRDDLAMQIRQRDVIRPLDPEVRRVVLQRLGRERQVERRIHTIGEHGLAREDERQRDQRDRRSDGDALDARAPEARQR